jgi:hypothetical protein
MKFLTTLIIGGLVVALLRVRPDSYADRASMLAR